VLELQQQTSAYQTPGLRAFVTQYRIKDSKQLVVVIVAIQRVRGEADALRQAVTTDDVILDTLL